jgi:hypothetical protein
MWGLRSITVITENYSHLICHENMQDPFPEFPYPITVRLGVLDPQERLSHGFFLGIQAFW